MVTILSHVFKAGPQLYENKRFSFLTKQEVCLFVFFLHYAESDRKSDGKTDKHARGFFSTAFVVEFGVIRV